MVFSRFLRFSKNKYLTTTFVGIPVTIHHMSNKSVVRTYCDEDIQKQEVNRTAVINLVAKPPEILLTSQKKGFQSEHEVVGTFITTCDIPKGSEFVVLRLKSNGEESLSAIKLKSPDNQSHEVEVMSAGRFLSIAAMGCSIGFAVSFVAAVAPSLLLVPSCCYLGMRFFFKPSSSRVVENRPTDSTDIVNLKEVMKESGEK